MGRTRRAVAAIAVVATLGTGTVTACTGPPPTQTDFDNIGRGLAGVVWLVVIGWMDSIGACWVECLPIPGGPGQAPVDTTPPLVAP